MGRENGVPEYGSNRRTSPAAFFRGFLRQPRQVGSGIPFSKMPETVATRVAQAVRDNLAEGGRFIAYQFRRDVAGITDPIMGPPASCTLELRNIPPMRVYSWVKTAKA